ncbi:hypothetical protein [Streptomyces abyssomicinicus]|uniref:hypothetical protein n=1 Tax=Streptomyces abyssomicinicus TaxID=574929 RepID=UPI00125014DD|nr:hypothetical protein [Streptomyces abyssomicinicus]
MEPTPAERAWLDTFEELRNSPDVELEMETLEFAKGEPPDADTAFGTLAEHDGVVLDPSLQRCYLRFAGMGASWGAGMTDEDEDPLFGGDFYVIPLLQAIRDTAPIDRYPLASPEERPFISELRDIDVTSVSGAGMVTSLRIRPGASHNPEVWFSDTARGLYKLDVDLCGYLDALRITKGTLGWQYLFADVSLTDDRFEVTARFLTTMLQVFPDLFPAHDYTQLRTRLEERL